MPPSLGRTREGFLPGWLPSRRCPSPRAPRSRPFSPLGPGIRNPGRPALGSMETSTSSTTRMAFPGTSQRLVNCAGRSSVGNPGTKTDSYLFTLRVPPGPTHPVGVCCPDPNHRGLIQGAPRGNGGQLGADRAPGSSAGPSLVSLSTHLPPSEPGPKLTGFRVSNLQFRLRDPMTLVRSHCWNVLGKVQPQSFCGRSVLQPCTCPCPCPCPGQEQRTGRGARA